MKKKSLFMFCIILVAALFISCAGVAGAAAAPEPAARGVEMDFNDARGTVWVLSEIRRGNEVTRIDRGWLEANHIGDWFTISFAEGSVSGTAAPNGFFGPYTLGGGRALGFGNLAHTLMASFIVVEELKEFEYFAYLNNVTRWNLSSGRLELYSSTGGGAEAILVFETN